MPQITLTITKKQYYLLYNLSLIQRKSISEIAREALYLEVGQKPKTHTHHRKKARLIPPTLDQRPENKPIKMTIYLTPETLKIAEKLAQHYATSRRNIVTEILLQYVQKQLEKP